MINSDKPIEKQDDDELKRVGFSKQLAKAIMSYSKEDNFVIGVCGPWGSGKTSILNMVLEEIGTISESNTEEERPIIIRYNPWAYADCSQLMVQFISLLASKIGFKNKSKTLNIIGKELDKYATLLEEIQLIPGMQFFASPLSKVVGGTGRKLVEKADMMEKLDSKKDRIAKELCTLKRKIVVVIDDIDRLNNDQIRAVFQLVNAVAGFPNMIYILAFDRDVVARALSQEQNCKGDEYLEKIIQVPFDVPVANRNTIHDIFVSRLVNAGFDDLNGDLFSMSYWRDIFNGCIAPFIVSIRDINRILNSFEFKYNYMKSEVNGTDLLAITVLDICVPGIIEWILENKGALLGGVDTKQVVSNDERSTYERKCLEEFNLLRPGSEKKVMGALRVLFPKFCYKITGQYYENVTSANLRRANRIADAQRFDRYFNLSLEEIPITQKDLMKSIGEYNQTDLTALFEELVDSDGFEYYIEDLGVHIEDIPQERREGFIYALISIQERLLSRRYKEPWAVVVRLRCFEVIEKILLLNGKSENKEILINVIKRSDASNIESVAYLMDRIESAFGDDGKIADSRLDIISQEDLIAVEKEFAVALDKNINNIFEMQNFERLYYLWGLIDEEGRTSHIKGILHDDINIPKVLCLFASKWSSSDGGYGWVINVDEFAQYMESSIAYDGIMRLKNKDFCKLERRFKEIAITFFLQYGQNASNMHNRIGNKILDKLIVEWE